MSEIPQELVDAAWKGVLAKQEQRESAFALTREEFGERYADSYIARLREQFARDEIDLETFEQQAAMALRGYVPELPDQLC